MLAYGRIRQSLTSLVDLDGLGVLVFLPGLLLDTGLDLLSYLDLLFGVVDLDLVSRLAFSGDLGLLRLLVDW